MPLILLVFLLVNLGCHPSKQLTQSKIHIENKASIHEKWAFLEEVLSNKRIVALGENLHGVKEYNHCKLELIQYLHEELGFNVIATESDLAKNYFGNENRHLIADTLFLKELFTPVWHTEEHLNIVRYLKEHPKLKIIGFDIEFKVPMAQLSKELGINIDSSSHSCQSFLKQYAKWDEVNGRIATSMGKRDSTMADVLKWIIDDLYKDEKIIISAHNAHISSVEEGGSCMGELLRKKYKKAYYNIGFFHALGDPKHVLRNMIYENDSSSFPKNSIQANFLKIGGDQVFIATKQQLRIKEYGWLKERLYNVLLSKWYRQKIVLSESFDGLIWIKQVTHPKYIIRNKYLEKY